MGEKMFYSPDSRGGGGGENSETKNLELINTFVAELTDFQRNEIKEIFNDESKRPNLGSQSVGKLMRLSEKTGLNIDELKERIMKII